MIHKYITITITVLIINFKTLSLIKHTLLLIPQSKALRKNLPIHQITILTKTIQLKVVCISSKNTSNRNTINPSNRSRKTESHR